MDHQPHTSASELIHRVFPWEERAGVPLVEAAEIDAEATGG